MEHSYNEDAPGRVPPHDLDAERSVIGAMLVSEAAIGEVAEILVEPDFYSERHRMIFSAVMAMHTRGEAVDRITLTDELKRLGLLRQVGGEHAIWTMYESVPVASNAARYAELIKDKSIHRALIDSGTRICDLGFSEGRDGASVLDAAEQLVFDVSRGADPSGGFAPLGDVSMEVLSDTQRCYDAGGQITGLSSGFGDLDRITTGIHDDDLVVLAARPAMGKTSMALGQCWHTAGVENKGVALFSLEMSKKQIGQRLISLNSRIPIQNIRTGNISGEDWPRLVKATNLMSKVPLHIDDSVDLSISLMRSRLRRLRASFERSGTPLSLVVVDYLQLMVDDKRENRQQEIAAISRAMKVLARDLGVPVLLLSQLSRAVEQRNDKRPMLSDLRESGAIEQDADMVQFLYRDEYYNEESEDRGIAEVIVAKHRNGATGRARLAWLEQTARFENLARDVEVA